MTINVCFARYIHNICFIVVALGLLFSSSASLAKNGCEGNTDFNVGAGIYDITGPAAESGMMGYAMLNQRTAGISMRLWARAFVIESPCNGERAVFVNADLGQIFQAVKQQVIVRLQKARPNRYNDANVLLTATHTHSGPGGYSTYTLYSLTTLGFEKENFDAIVDGIVQAILRAEANMAPATIKFAKGDLDGISHNRSPTSYLKNPESERARYAHDYDSTMTLVRFDRKDGTPIGLINWFPLHGVSLNKHNYLISGDNKGYAEYLFEKDFNSDYGSKAFVAAFAQSNSGDVSPNRLGTGGASGDDGIKAVVAAGKPQYLKAKELYQSASQLVTGGVGVRHRYAQMDRINVDAEYTNGALDARTCTAAIGVSMLAGTQDGEGFGEQGITCEKARDIFSSAICKALETKCQGVKPIALATGEMEPYSWTPNVLPFQVMAIGNIVIVAAPFELTTMTGRRMTAAVQQAAPRGSEVVISALSNAYAGYVTTLEEYMLQRYEAASTLFGPWQQAALVQEFTRLTKALYGSQVITDDAMPIDLLPKVKSFVPKVIYDGVPIWLSFGSVKQDVRAIYNRGETVSVTFWGAHPRNGFNIQGSFLEVQKYNKGQWETVRLDRDFDTEYHWRRESVDCSHVTIVWRTDQDTQPGHYRILHHGHWKSGWTGSINPYTGTSSLFTVQ